MLDGGEIWNRHDFPEQTVIEIRPEQRINKFDTPILGSVSSLLDFSGDRIAELKRRGYEDARRCLQPIIETFRGVQAQRQSHNSLINSTQHLLNDPPLGVLSTPRDIPPERLYKLVRVAEKGIYNPDLVSLPLR